MVALAIAHVAAATDALLEAETAAFLAGKLDKPLFVETTDMGACFGCRLFGIVDPRLESADDLLRVEELLLCLVIEGLVLLELRLDGGEGPLGSDEPFLDAASTRKDGVNALLGTGGTLGLLLAAVGEEGDELPRALALMELLALPVEPVVGPRCGQRKGLVVVRRRKERRAWGKRAKRRVGAVLSGISAWVGERVAWQQRKGDSHRRRASVCPRLRHAWKRAEKARLWHIRG